MNILNARFEGESLFVGDHPIPLDEKSLALLRSSGASRLFLGVRPEQLEVSDNDDGLEATIDLIEPMGGESNIYLSAVAGSLIAKVGGISLRARGDTVRVGFSQAAMHFFDGESGLRLE